MTIDLISWRKKSGDQLWHYECNELVDKVNQLIEWVNNYDQRHVGSGSIDNAVVVGVNHTYTFTGEPITPEFRLYKDGNLLVKGEDYDSQIDNNTEIGTATITIYGIGDYSGEKVVTFAIEGAKYNLSYQSEYGTVPMARRISVLTPEDVPTLTDADYNFLGWYDEDNRQYNVGTILTHDVVLIAKWEAKTFTLTYNANGHGTTPTQPTGKLSAIPAELPPMSAEGYYFAGWYNGSTKVNGGEMITEDTMLTAKWVANGVYFDIHVDDETHASTLTFSADEQVEEIMIEYSDDGGETWQEPTSTPIALNETKGYRVRLKYDGTVIATSADATITAVDDNDEHTLSFTSTNGTVLNAATSEAIGTLDLSTDRGTYNITDGVTNGVVIISNN